VANRTAVANRAVATNRPAAIAERTAAANRVAANRAAATGARTNDPSWGRSHGWSHRGGYWYHNGQRSDFAFIAGVFPWVYDDYWAYYYPYGDYPYYGYNTYGTPAAVGESTAVSVQSVLKQNGYYSGPIDGIVGPGTRAAISSYQASNGLPVTGQIDQGLISSLGL
jgi:hypothetical protein